MTTLTDQQVADFWRNGFLVVREVIPNSEISELRGAVIRQLAAEVDSGKVIKRADYTLYGDLSVFPELCYLPVDQRLLDLAGSLLSEELVYFRDSSIRVGRGDHGWHKDNRAEDRYDPEGPDWEREYPLLRIGLYLQDHSRHSGGLSLRSGSHLPCPTLIQTRVERRLGRCILKGFSKKGFIRKLASGLYHVGKPLHVDTRPGDLVIWNLRTTHSGNSVRVRPFPTKKFSAVLEPYIPRWLQVPEEAERIAIFLTYGRKSVHLDRYLKYVTRQSYFEKVLTTKPCQSFIDDVANHGQLTYLNPRQVV